MKRLSHIFLYDMTKQLETKEKVMKSLRKDDEFFVGGERMFILKKRLMKSMLLCLAMGMTLTLLACGNQGESGATQLDPEVLVRNCIGCHGTDLRGRSGPSLEVVGEKYSQEEIATIILNGMGRMPKMKNFNEEQADILAAWLLDRD